MGLEVGRKVGGIILPLKACGRDKRTDGISAGNQAEQHAGKSDLLHSYIMLNRLAFRRHGYNLKRTTALACVRLGARAYMRTYVRTHRRTHRHTCAHIHMRAHIPSVRHVDLAVGCATDRYAYLPTCLHEKPKSLTESLKSSTPRRDFKSFPSCGRHREMGILSKPSAYAAKISNFVV